MDCNIAPAAAILLRMNNDSPPDHHEGLSPASDARMEAKEWTEQLMSRLALGEQRLGLQPGLFSRLLTDPDYLSVIQMHAAVETGVNELITLGFSAPHGGLGGTPNSERFASVASFARERLQLSGRAGKLELAMRLKVLSKASADFVSALAVIRNRYAHNIRNANRPLRELVQEEIRGNGNIRKHLLMAPVGADLPNDVMKLLLVSSFSYFLKDLDRQHIPVKGLLDLWTTVAAPQP